jgi:hypothetical protein
LVLKTAEDAPLGVLMMAEACQEFLPPGVLNVLTGLGEECGGPLAQHPLVRKLSFTPIRASYCVVQGASADFWQRHDRSASKADACALGSPARHPGHASGIQGYLTSNSMPGYIRTTPQDYPQ